MVSMPTLLTTDVRMRLVSMSQSLVKMCDASKALKNNICIPLFTKSLTHKLIMNQFGVVILSTLYSARTGDNLQNTNCQSFMFRAYSSNLPCWIQLFILQEGSTHKKLINVGKHEMIQGIMVFQQGMLMSIPQCIIRYTQSMIAYKILTEYFWKFQRKITLWECC